MEDALPSSNGYATTWGIVVLILICFLFPPPFLLPLKFLGLGNPGNPIISNLFIPVRYLSDHIPAYKELISKESAVTGVR